MGLKKRTAPVPKKAGVASKRVNPFDMKVTKPKFDVLNRDNRGTRGAPSQAKQRSTAIRAATLLPELASRGKQSSFVDRRFGERDKSLGEEEKMLERFSRERQKASSKGDSSSRTGQTVKTKKKSIFNLDAGDEYGDDSLAGLTHMGKDVEELSEFSDPEEGAFSHEKGFIDQKSVRRGHFGGFQDEEDDQQEEEEVPKTRAEVMKEVIAKSKFYKAERQKAKEENEELCLELDKSFSALRPALLPSKHDRSQERRGDGGDEYDQALKAMLFDKRSKPTDRMLTEGEERERREKAEDAREARMQGRKADSDDSDDDHDEDNKVKRKEKTVIRDTEREEERALELLEQFCSAKTLEDLSGPYNRIVTLSVGPSSVALGRAIRTLLSTHTSTLSTSTRPFLPSKPTLLLLHLVSRVYSVTDWHHVVVSPAGLLAAGWLESGRMTRPKHLVSALFLAQTLLAYHGEAGRIVPEVFNLLSLLLAYLFPSQSQTQSQSQLAYDGYYNRLIRDRLSPHTPTTPVTLKPIGFDVLDMTDREFGPEIAETILAATLSLIKESSIIYAECPSFPELFSPLMACLQGTCHATSLPLLASRLASGRRKPLALQHHKPIALPMLTPDLEPDQDRASRDTSRLKAAYKREFKGAKRELRRDNEFLARHEALERRRKDADYKQMINRVYGTIANDNAGLKDGKKRRTK